MNSKHYLNSPNHLFRVGQSLKLIFGCFKCLIYGCFVRVSSKFLFYFFNSTFRLLTKLVFFGKIFLHGSFRHANGFSQLQNWVSHIYGWIDQGKIKKIFQIFLTFFPRSSCFLENINSLSKSVLSVCYLNVLLSQLKLAWVLGMSWHVFWYNVRSVWNLFFKFLLTL